MGIQSFELYLEVTIVFSPVDPVRVQNIMPRTHLLKGYSSSRLLGQSRKPVGLKSSFVGILRVFSDGTFDLLSSRHSIELSKSLLLGGQAVGVFLQMGRDFVGLVLLTKEVRSRPVEVVLVDVSKLQEGYLSTMA